MSALRSRKRPCGGDSEAGTERKPPRRRGFPRGRRLCVKARMRIVFMGTPEFAVPVLQALAGAGHDVVAAYSQPPRPAGRGKALRPSPGAGARRGAGDRGAHATHAARSGGAGGVRGAGGGRGGGGGLWADPAARGARCAFARVPQRPCFAAAALAGRRADPAGDTGGRRPRRACASCRWRPGWIPGRCGWRGGRRSTARRRAS